MLRDYLATGGYSLDDAVGRIDYGVAAGKIDPEQAGELLELAQSMAGGVDTQAQLAALTERVASIEAKVTELASAAASGGGNSEGESGEVIPDWVRPTGAHDAWALGAKVRKNGHIFVSNIPANTTVPGKDSRWWTMVS